MKNQIFKLLDSIEDKDGRMAHEIPEIKDSLHKWQSGELKDSFFKETLNKYFDKLWAQKGGNVLIAKAGSPASRFF